MSEKRFKKGVNLSCVDTETGKSYWYACNLCGLLNEQQIIINNLKQENEKLKEERQRLIYHLNKEPTPKRYVNE